MTISVRQAISAHEAKAFDTDALRQNFLIEKVFSPDAINLTYSHLDRTIVGGAMPVKGNLKLESSKPVGSPGFLDRRELGIFNVGGTGRIRVNDAEFLLQSTDCLYVPRESGTVIFESDDAGMPAKFYLVSTPAHRACTIRHLTADDARRVDLGSGDGANERILRQYIHPQVCESCQLVMGMTALRTGSVWNTMPCHTHDRRSEVYLYFNMLPETRVFHFMGEPDETRHLVVADEQAILSPGWSIHCGAGTAAYAFIWSMAGDNQDFDDMDFVAMEDLR